MTDKGDRMEAGWPHSENDLAGEPNVDLLAERHGPTGTIRDGLVSYDEFKRQQLARGVQMILDALPTREDDDPHIAETAQRAAKMWAELTKGYDGDPADVLVKTFDGPRDPGLVIQSGILLQSVCAHHLLPFYGRATVAYRPSPGQQVVGLSKLSRVVQGYAARLQIQERIGSQVVEAIMDRLNPSGAMCLITAAHDCMRLRGVRDAGSTTTTQARNGLLLPEEVNLIHMTHQGDA